jgi:ubiquitin C-terminal hydrolase
MSPGRSLRAEQRNAPSRAVTHNPMSAAKWPLTTVKAVSVAQCIQMCFKYAREGVGESFACTLARWRDSSRKSYQQYGFQPRLSEAAHTFRSGGVLGQLY